MAKIIFNAIMEIFEKKGIIRILLALIENNNSISSMYQLEVITTLSKTTIKNNIQILSDYKFVILNRNVGPRMRTEIKLTKLGTKFAKILRELKEELNKL